MATAAEIIRRCGGIKTVADWLGLDRSAVQRWSTRDAHGRGGEIPPKHWAALIHSAKSHAIEIGLEELAPTAAVEAASRRIGKAA